MQITQSKNMYQRYKITKKTLLWKAEMFIDTKNTHVFNQHLIILELKRIFESLID